MTRSAARLTVLLAAALVVAGLSAVPARAAGGVTLLFNAGPSPQLGSGEMAWFRGSAPAGATVRIYRVTPDGDDWVGSVKASPRGWFTRRDPAPRTGTYRAVAAGASSDPVTVGWDAERTLEEREAALGWLLGSPVTSVRTEGDARWRDYEHGVLVERAGRVRLVLGAAATAYRRRGGVAGALGVPQRDPRCGLAEGACLQHFDRGAIYVNDRARHSPVVQVGAPRRAGLVAVARSQVGYTEPSYRHSKYSVWMGQTGLEDAWCGFFQAWVSWASGEGEAIVKRPSFREMVRAERERGRLRSKPARGYLAYLGRPAATHVALIVKVAPDYLLTVEGNVGRTSYAGYPRGVFLVRRPRSHVNFYAEPLFP